MWMPLPTVRVVNEAVPSRIWLPDPAAVITIVPVPPSVWVPEVNAIDVAAPVPASVNTAFSVRPLDMPKPVALPMVRSLMSVTPFSSPLLAVVTREAPSAKAIVPPTIVPPNRFQDPVTAFSSNPLLVRVPVRFTAPPVRLMVPIAAVVNVPPRFSVELFTVIVFALLHTPANDNVELVAVMVPVTVFDHAPVLMESVAPLIASSTALLVKVLMFNIRVRPETSALMVPLLISVFADVLWVMVP